VFDPETDDEDDGISKNTEYFLCGSQISLALLHVNIQSMQKSQLSGCSCRWRWVCLLVIPLDPSL